MTCSNCGKRVISGKFCSFCGANIEECARVEASKNKVKKYTLGIIILVLIIVSVLLFILVRPSKSDRFIELIEDKKYEEAVAYYDNTIYGDSKETQKAYEKAIAKIEKIIEQYNNGEISYDEAYDEIGSYTYFYTEEMEKATTRLGALYYSKESFVNAENEFISQNYESAISSYSQVIEEDINYETSQERLKEASTYLYKSTLEQCEQAINEGNYAYAITLMQGNLTYLVQNDQADAQSKIEEYTESYMMDITDSVETFLTESMYVEAITFIEQKYIELGNVPKLVELEQKTIEKYENYIKTCAEKYINEKSYNECALLLNEAQLILPDSKIINGLYEELKKCTPIELAEIHIFDEKIDNKSRYSNQKDSYQNEYEYSVRYSIYGSEEQYIEYLLKDIYQHFSCVITPAEKWTNNKNSVKIAIWGDDVKLYETTITRASYSISVDLNVVGIEKLKITFEKSGYNNAYILFADAYVYEKI